LCTFVCTFIKYLCKITDNIGVEGLTLSEMSKNLGIPVNTLRQRITRLGIKPLTQEAIYSPEVQDMLKNVRMGRPRKTPEPTKPVKKAKK
jgi:predicted ArsR family transcriptional regulator